ncbi:MAG: hypothetical protein L6Q37_06225 [Bdellovibrionaceae bacterium]|nr:hypothetical protein [Pseudobdellovibrionaceae bacterium]NUM60287.1 hypothetical protein [Pseudobdellovibrionaceae bacterium]
MKAFLIVISLYFNVKAQFIQCEGTLSFWYKKKNESYWSLWSSKNKRFFYNVNTLNPAIAFGPNSSELDYNININGVIFDFKQKSKKYEFKTNSYTWFLVKKENKLIRCELSETLDF